MSEGSPLRPGDLLDGKYGITGLLGAGSMGLVYSARHLALARVVAVKTLRSEIADDTELVARFQQEARAAGALGHPNIVQIFDAGVTDVGLHYIVMERLDGQSLYQLIEQEPLLDPERAGRIMAQVLSALEVAHKRGIVHRDLKPENIFLARGEDGGEQVKLLDFGISKVLEHAAAGLGVHDLGTRATRLGVVMGTPLYMSPEQARGAKQIDHRADLWSAACVLYELVCGRTPFEGENYNQVMSAILDDAFDPPRTVRPSLTLALERVILKGKAFEPADRYPDAAAMRVALVAAIDGMTGDRQRAAADTDDPYSALDRLSEGALQVGPVSAPAPASAPAPVSAPATTRPAAHPRPDSEGAAFRPPPEQSESMRLDLDPAAVRHVSVARAPERVPVRAGTMAAQRPRRSGGFGTMIATAAILLAVAGIGGIAYRYYTLGYLLSPPVPQTGRIEFRISPDEAEVEVHGAVLAARQFDGPVDSPRRFLVRAPGRLSVEREASPRAGQVVEIADRLPIAMPRIDVALARLALPPAARSGGAITPAAVDDDGAIDSAFGKLDLYARCLAAIAGPLLESQQAYAKSARDRITLDRLPIVIALPPDAVAECQTVAATARERKPALDRVDAAGTALADELTQLAPMLRELADYYAGDGPQRDKLARGRAGHRPLGERLDRTLIAARALAGQLWDERARWQEADLAALERADGKTGHWHMRRLALASQRWVLAELGQAADRDQRKQEVAAAFADADSLVRSDVDALARLRGAGEYLRAAAAVLRESGEQAATWHNTSVELFNAMVILR